MVRFHRFCQFAPPLSRLKFPILIKVLLFPTAATQRIHFKYTDKKKQFLFEKNKKTPIPIFSNRNWFFFIFLVQMSIQTTTTIDL